MAGSLFKLPLLNMKTQHNSCSRVLLPLRNIQNRPLYLKFNSHLQFARLRGERVRKYKRLDNLDSIWSEHCVQLGIINWGETLASRRSESRACCNLTCASCTLLPRVVTCRSREKLRRERSALSNKLLALSLLKIRTRVLCPLSTSN